MIACSEMSDSSDSENEIYDTQEPTFPEAAEEALLNMNNRLRAENGDLRTRLKEAKDTEWLDKRLIKDQKAKHRSRVSELSTRVHTLRNKIRMLEMENERLRRQNAALSGVPLMRPAKLSDMRW